MMKFSSTLFLIVLSCLVLVVPYSQVHAQVADTLVLREGLVLELPKGYAETIIAPNPVEADLAMGKWRAPAKGLVVTFPNGEKGVWKQMVCDSKGWFGGDAFNGCYVYFPLEMNPPTVRLLEAMGNEMAYVNGSPRSGNPYGLKEDYEGWEPHFDFSSLPIQLGRGRNDLLFRCSRGVLKVRLVTPKSPVTLNHKDVTMPDFIAGQKIDTWGSIVVVNSTNQILSDLLIQASIGSSTGNPIKVPVVQPLSVRKVGFHLEGEAIPVKGMCSVVVSIFREADGRTVPVDTTTIIVRVVNQEDNHRESFISNIDGSVQYFAITPSTTYGRERPAALVLSLHGAGVEAINQSGSYYPKRWAHIIAPTNRRPYGYNWEEWGRLDAMEVLDVVKEKYKIDESRIYLTGHSMGGHGVWHIGSLFPDQFAAIGPSAGWISFWTYRFRGQNVVDTTDIRRMIRRSTTPSETFMHVENYKQLGVYVLHGSDDDNVPVEQARSMVEHLNGIHKDFVYHEQPKAGHWWDISDEPGTDCVDWPPMFDFFARHARPLKDRVLEINFMTANPGVSSKNNWVTIDAQFGQLKMSSVSIRFDPGMRRFVGSTRNVERLAIDTDILGSEGEVIVQLDSQKLSAAQMSPADQQMWFEKLDGKWGVVAKPSQELKGSHRYGTLKEAFRNSMIFVYGTRGTDEENKWAFGKARYDAEKYWYQGNGSVDVVSDVKFDPSIDPDRNVILFGNRKTNAAWKALLSESPVQVDDGSVTIGDQKLRGRELGCIFVRPRRGSATASIGAVSGSGLTGMRICNRLPYTSPGIGLPDCTVLSPEILTEGDAGVVMTGFFGLDWSVINGEFVWQDKYRK
jgi:pimeloyl-ACP methyl ester carboxylesterase